MKIRTAAQIHYCRPPIFPPMWNMGPPIWGLGQDSIWEANKNVYELVDLKFGYAACGGAPPGGPGGGRQFSRRQGLRIATKFPAVAQEYIRQKGLQAEIIKLHGNIELAPLVGLADLVIDIVSSGRTLKENDLVPLEFMGEATARLIVNRASYRLKSREINELVGKIKRVLETEGGELS